MKAPICVVGANAVGLTTALLLAKNKIAVRLIDPLDQRQEHSEYALLFPSSLELFEKIGLVDSFLERGQKVEHFKFYKSSHVQVDLDFSTLKTPYPYICTLTQHDLEEVLLQELVLHDVTIERGVKLKKIEEHEDHLNLSLSHQESFTASYLIGCDGAQSQVRKLAKIKKERYGFTHRYVMADVMLSWNEKPTTVASFQHPKGYVVILPIKANHYRMVCDLKEDSRHIVASKSHFKEVLLQRVPLHLDIEDIEWLSALEFRGYQAKAYRKNRLFLVGESAHSLSPLGEGVMNSGFLDAFNLCWKLSHVYKKEARSVLLSSYSRERMPLMKKAFKNTRRLLELASSSNLFQKKLRDLFLFLFHTIETLKERALLDLSGLNQHYKQSPIILKKHFLRWRKGLCVGSRVQECWLIHQSTREKTRFFELLWGQKHHLVLYFPAKKQQQAKEIEQRVLLKYSSFVSVHLISFSKELQHQNSWLDESKEFSKHYHLGSSFMVLIRPDHVIGALSSLLEYSVIETYFEHYLTLSKD